MKLCGAWKKSAGAGSVGVIIIALISVLVAQPVSATPATPISGPTVINSSGTYTLTQDFIGQNGTFIEIQASNVTLNGQNYTLESEVISGFGSSGLNNRGIYVDGEASELSNVHVKNVTLKDWRYGIYFNNVSGGSIRNLTINSSESNGIVLDKSSNISIIGNRVTNTNQTWQGGFLVQPYEIAIELTASSHRNLLKENTITHNSWRGIQILGNDNEIYGNIVSENGEDGIVIANSSYNTVERNSVSHNFDGVELYTGANNTKIVDNIVKNNTNGIHSTTQYSLINRTLVPIGEFPQDTLIRGNVIRESSGSGLILNGNNFSIYDNAFYNNNNVRIENVSRVAWNTTKTTNKNVIGGGEVGGNYWGRPSGYGFSQMGRDDDGNGFVDAVHRLSNNNTDYLPLFNDVPALNISHSGPVIKTGSLPATITTEGSASDQSGLMRVEVSVNDGVPTVLNKEKRETINWTQSVKLNEYFNTLTFTAFDQYGVSTSNQLRVIVGSPKGPEVWTTYPDGRLFRSDQVEGRIIASDPDGISELVVNVNGNSTYTLNFNGTRRNGSRIFMDVGAGNRESLSGIEFGRLYPWTENGENFNWTFSPSGVIRENNLTYTSAITSEGFEWGGFGTHPSIGVFGERYIPVNNDTEHNLRLLRDSADIVVLERNESLPLENGYAIKLEAVSINGEKALISLTKNGIEQDSAVVEDGTRSPRENYTYEADIGTHSNVPVIKAHIASIHRGPSVHGVNDSIVIDGHYQFSTSYKTPSDFEAGVFDDSHGGPYMPLAMDSKRDLVLRPNTTLEIRPGLYLQVSDEADPSRREYHFYSGNSSLPHTVKLNRTINLSSLGSNRINVTAFDALGNHNSSEVFVDYRPHGEVDAGPDRTVRVGENVTFKARDVVGNFSNYTWYFGDNHSARGARAIHSYASPGVYGVTLEATNTSGGNWTAWDTTNITVLSRDSPPTVNISAPVNGSTINILNLLVTWAMHDDYGISEANVVVNGRIVSTWRPGNSSDHRPTYAPGQWNEITVRVNDTSGNVASDTVRVFIVNSSTVVSNVTANQTTKIRDPVRNTSTELEVQSRVNGTAEITVSAHTDPGELSNSTNASHFESYAAGDGGVPLGAYVRIEPGGILNDSNNLSHAVIRMHYTDEQLDRDGNGTIGDPGDLDPASLKIHRFFPSTGEWVALTEGNVTRGNETLQVYGTGVNTSGRYIWANVSHFSLYGLSGEEVPEQGSDNSNDEESSGDDSSDDDSEGSSGGGSSGSGSSGSSDSGGSSGGGGGGGTPAEDSDNVAFRFVDYIWSISKGDSVEFQFEPDENEPTPVVREVRFGYESIADNVRVELQELEGPTTLRESEPQGMVYRHFNFYVSLPLKTALENPELEVAVERAWLDQNDVSVNDLRIARWNHTEEEWRLIDLHRVEGTGTHVILAAEVPGFSQYAITAIDSEPEGEKTPEPVGGTSAGGVTATPTVTRDAGDGGVPGAVLRNESSRGLPGFEVPTGMIALLIGVYLVRRRRT